MRPLAFLPNVATPPHSPPPAQGASGAAASPSAFAAVLSGFDAPVNEAKPKGDRSDDAAQTQKSIANAGGGSQETPSPPSPPSIEAALAALVYPSSAPSANPAANNPSPQIAGANPARSAAAVAAPRTPLPAPQRAVAAGAIAPENLRGEPVEVALQNSLSSDPTLGLQSVQTRTHLAPAGAAAPVQLGTEPAEAASPANSLSGDPKLGLQSAQTPAPLAPAGATSNPPPQATPAPGDSQPPGPAAPAAPQQPLTPAAVGGPISAALLGSIAAAAPMSPAPPPPAAENPRSSAPAAQRTPPGARLATAPSSPAPASARGQATSAPGSPDKSYAVSRTSGESSGASQAASDVAVEGASLAAPATSGAALATGAPSAIGINQLADFVATQAASLSAEIPPATSVAAPATAAPQAVKELEIALNPADLGTVSIKMRLANGKLTIVIGAANPSTLQAIESDRQAIVDRLSTSQQPLESLIVQSDGPTQNLYGGNDASDLNESRQGASNGNPASSERGAGGGSKFQRDQAASETLGATSRRGSGDLIV
jgi:hypothetical protein